MYREFTNAPRSRLMPKVGKKRECIGHGGGGHFGGRAHFGGGAHFGGHGGFQRAYGNYTGGKRALNYGPYISGGYDDFGWYPYAYYPYYYYEPYDWYFGGVPTSAQEFLPPLPNWVGKVLIAPGYSPPLTRPYVLESQIHQPYIVIRPNQVAPDYQTGRLSIFVDPQNVIENVRYG